MARRARPRVLAGLLLTPLLLQGWSPSLATFWNTVAWTLSAELFLYAAFPYLLRLPHPRAQPEPASAAPPKPNHRTALRLVALLLAVWAIGLIPHTLYLVLNPDHLAGPADRYSYGSWLRTLKYTPLAYVCTFLAGITLARLHTALPLTPRQRASARRRQPRRPRRLLRHRSSHASPTSSFTAASSSPSSPSSSSASAASTRSPPLFSFRPLVLLGQTTFCLYLLHFNTINLIRDTHLPERLHLAALDPWISYAAALAIAAAATFYIERPARTWLLQQTLRPTPTP